MTKTHDEDHDIIIGLDFGTTSSGCCFQQVSKDNKYKIETVSIWPKMGNASSAKVPTELLYVTNKPVFWGYRARHYKQQQQTEKTIISNFKKQYQDIKTIDYVADYLKGVMDHAFQTIYKMTRIKSFNTSFCMLVPAVSDDETRSRIRQAIHKAGLKGPLLLAPEPEAVAMFCLENRKELNLNENETLLICNAGGGIIDLSIYKIAENNYLEEVALGIGGLYGASLIDEKMRKYIQKVFFDQEINMTDDALDFMVLEFISRVKPYVELEDENESANKGAISLHPSLYDCQFKTDNVSVGDGAMEIDIKYIANEMFSPVIVEVIKLIDTQMKRCANIDHMVLTGGFSLSGYFYKSIHSTFKDKIKSIRSFQDGEEIAMKGAIHFAKHPDRISKRILRRTYGIKCPLIFEESFFVKQGDEFISWPFRKKSLQSAAKPICTKHETTFPPANFVAEIYTLDEDEELKKKEGEESMFKLDDPNCKRVANFDIPFPSDIKKQDKITYQVQVFLVQTEIKIKILVDDYIGEFISIYTDNTLTFDYKNNWKKVEA